MREDLLAPWIAAIKKQKFYQLTECSMCNYPTGWGFFEDTGYDGLMWDGGCHCVTYDGRRPADESDLHFYLDPEHGHIQKIEEFIASANLVEIRTPIVDTPAIDAAIEMLMDTATPVHQTEFRLRSGNALLEIRRLLGGKP